MAPRHLKDELDPGFLRRQWIVQRVGWALMLAIIVATLLGLFGTSPLAGRVERVERDGAVYELEYPRLTRYEHADRFHVRVHAPAATGDELRIAFSPSFVSNAHVRSSFPPSDGAGADGSGMYLSYKVEGWSDARVVTFEYEPRKAFAWDAVVTVKAGDLPPAEIPLAQWVYP